MSRLRRDESGLTLIELMIALVVMAIISVTVLGSLTTLSTASENQRGIANVDNATLSYAEAIKHHVNFSTTLTSAITSTSQSSFTVADASELSAPVELVVGGELMEAKTVSGNALSNVVRGDRGTTAWTYALGTTVSSLYTPCPTAAQLAPLTFTPPTNLSSIRITAVDYWFPSTQTFESGETWNGSSYSIQSGHADCETAFETLCPSYSGDTGLNWSTASFQSGNLPECDAGLERVTIQATGDATTANSQTTTEVLVRRGTG